MATAGAFIIGDPTSLRRARYLNKRDDEDREDWLRYAIAFMRRGLWLDDDIAIHGPHDKTSRMWGDAWATVDGTDDHVPCFFFAKARGSEYDPANIRVYMGEAGERVDEETERFPLVKVSQLTPQARLWLRSAERTADKLRRERQARFF